MPEKLLAKGLKSIDTIGNRETRRPSVLSYPFLDGVGLLCVPGDHRYDTGYHVVGVIDQLLLVYVGFQGIAALPHLPGVKDVDKDLAQLLLGEAIILSRIEKGLEGLIKINLLRAGISPDKPLEDFYLKGSLIFQDDGVFSGLRVESFVAGKTDTVAAPQPAGCVGKGVACHVLGTDAFRAEALDDGVPPLEVGQPLEVLAVILEVRVVLVTVHEGLGV